MAVMIDQSGPNPVVISKTKAGGVSLRTALKKQNITLADIPDSKGRYAVPRTDQSGFPIINLGSSQYGALTVTSLIATNLSAVSAYTGSLTVNGALTVGTGGNIHSGQTSYNVGSGYWIDAGPRFSLRDANGNFINIDLTGANPLVVSSSSIQGALSTLQVDNAGWSNTSVFNQISQTPTTIAGYGITDAQGVLPNASDVGQVLQRDNGGTPYFATKYGAEVNALATITNTSGAALTSTSYAQIGNTLGFPAPANATVMSAIAKVFYYAASGTPLLQLRLQASNDGGSTWTTLDQGLDGSGASYTTTAQGASDCLMGSLASGTGDIQIRVMGRNQSGTGQINVQATVFAVCLPNNNFYSIAGALAATIPATASGSCTATYPASSCTATKNVTVSPSAGVPPYTYSWSKVSGNGSITSGSTSITATVSDTETATSGGATYTTTIKCQVNDSASHSVTTSNCVITNTFTLVYNPITATVGALGGSCSVPTCGNSCTASGSATANATGGNGSYTYSWSVVSGGGSITAGSTSQTCTVSETHSVFGANTPLTLGTTVQCSVNDTRSTGAVTPQGTVNLTYSCPGA